MNRLQQFLLIVLIPLAALMLPGAFLSPTDFFRAYLTAYVFWISITFGCLVVLMLHFISGGAWGVLLRRILEAATRTSPLMAILLIPLVFGMRDLYPWTRAEVVANDPLLQHKSLYLNVPFFIARTVLYIVVWNAIIFLLNRWSVEQDRTGDPAIATRLRHFSAPALVLFGLTVTFAAIDYLMSLEPDWFSTIYAALVAFSGVLGAFAFAILVLALLSGREPFASAITPQLLNDLGNLLMAFVMIWAYLSYSQFLIIYSGNLTDDITWYLHRLQGGWEWLAILMVVLSFVIPFVVLLSRSLKRSLGMLALIASSILIARLINNFWLIAPSFAPNGFTLNWLDFVATFGIGAVWLWEFLRQLSARPLLPLHPRLQEITEPVQQHGT